MARQRTRTRGINEVLQKMAALPVRAAFAAQVGAVPGRETRTYTWPSGRTYTDKPKMNNVQIAQHQARHGRNVVFVSAAEKSVLLAVWAGAINELLRGDTSAVGRAAERIGSAIAENIRQHILTGRRSRGQIAPNAPNYARRRRARAHNRGADLSMLRPLYDTGQLFASFYGGARRLV